MILKKGFVLQPWQTREAVLWVTGPMWPDVHEIFPAAGDVLLDRAFARAKRTGLITWGHDEATVHYLAIRNGLPWHDDRKYARFTHQWIVRNDGWTVQGLDQREVPTLEAGRLYCLDTHSPHRVVRDPRLPQAGPNFVALTVDSDAPLTQEAAWLCLSARALDAAIP